jgi:hypothetical protein
VIRNSTGVKPFTYENLVRTLPEAKPGDRCELRFWVRGSGAEATGGIFGVCSDLWGNEAFTYAEHGTLTSDWRRVTLAFSGLDGRRLDLIIRSATRIGELLVDDIEVVRVGSDGIARWAPYTKLRCHFNFRWILDYSDGQVSDHGAHYVDIAQWGLGTERSGPVEVEGRGDFPSEGLFNVATAYHIEWTYANGVKMIGEEKGRDIVCTTFEGSEGTVHIGSGLQTEPASLARSEPVEERYRLPDINDHHGNFLDCVRSRKTPLAPIEEAHRSAAICHIGNIAMLLKRKLRWDPARERFVGDPEANRMLARRQRSPWTLKEMS